MATLCNCCKKPTDKHSLLTCSICRNSFRNTCVGMGSSESSRNVRSENRISFCLLEQPSGTSKDQRIAKENHEVNTIIESIKPDVRCDGVRIQRLAKFTATSYKPRPIKITFSDNHE
ncbi:hypothetical protein HHI36_011358, partial [Cryptolaemus montrouzieri]